MTLIFHVEISSNKIVNGHYQFVYFDEITNQENKKSCFFSDQKRAQGTVHILRQHIFGLFLPSNPVCKHEYAQGTIQILCKHVLRDFLTRPPTLCALLVRKNGQFLNPSTKSSPYVIFEWSIGTQSSHPNTFLLLTQYVYEWSLSNIPKVSEKA